MSDIRFATPNGELPGYLAIPDAPGPWPAVVVVHEAFGLNDDIRRWADRFAAEGYLALAPDLFGWGATMKCLVASFRSLRTGRGRAFDDIDAARRHLAEHAGSSGSVGVIGFCMGGGFALLAAPRGFDASSVNYGMVPNDAERVLSGACPVVASYGGRDRFLSGAAQRLEAALATVGADYDVKEYPDAGHSFLNDHSGWMAAMDKVSAPLLGGGHHAPSADDAWRRILVFFDQHVRGA